MENVRLRDWDAEKSRNSQVRLCKLSTNAFGAGSVFVCVLGGGALWALQEVSGILVSAH